MKPTINGTDPWELELSLQNLGRELKRIGAGDSLGFLLTDIENSAKHTKLIAPPTDPQELKLILDELNLFHRSLKRLLSAGSKTSRQNKAKGFPAVTICAHIFEHRIDPSPESKD